MNLADPELELIDPTPNVHNLFLHFDKVFFWAKLASRAVVRWSKRMYSCAGICSYEGRGGLCDIALSEPLLKLRPRKDLVETLLHEMIHAYLFITCQDRERDGHGPNFQSHMHRINKSAGLNISIYHDFHDEVELYLTHWWRCNGPCQNRKPYFGVVRQSQNRAPGPKDFWWSNHQKTCGGTFVKIKEPEKKTKKGKKTENKTLTKNGDITKYIINNNNKTLNTTSGTREPLTPLLKNSNKNTGTKVKANGGKTLVITQKNITSTPTKIKAPTTAFSGSGQVIAPAVKRNQSFDVTETVRNIWANKQLTGLNSTKSNIVNNNKGNKINNSDKNMKPIKQKATPDYSDSPPAKIKKIDEYFKTTASTLLKDLYGQDIQLTQENNKIIAVSNRNLVDCPICRQKIDSNEINKHLDECLNKDVIEQLSKDNIEPITQNTWSQSTDRKSLKDIVGNLPQIPAFKNKEIDDNHRIFNEENGDIKPIRFSDTIDLTHIDINYSTNVQTPDMKDDKIQFDTNDVKRVKAVVKRINYDEHVRKSDNFVVPKQETKEIDYGFLPSFLDDMGTAINPPKIKIEPGTSKDIVSSLSEQKCPCCGDVVNKPMVEHLDDCLAFSDNNTPEEGASTSFANNTIVIDDDDDDVFDETMTMNATGTKTPCPCCMEMVEMSDMNSHLDSCLS